MISCSKAGYVSYFTSMDLTVGATTTLSLALAPRVTQVSTVSFFVGVIFVGFVLLTATFASASLVLIAAFDRFRRRRGAKR
jgi:membrane protein implicated in regulation of membrane protease activity